MALLWYTLGFLSGAALAGFIAYEMANAEAADDTTAADNLNQPRPEPPQWVKDRGLD